MCWSYRDELRAREAESKQDEVREPELDVTPDPQPDLIAEEEKEREPVLV